MKIAKLTLVLIAAVTTMISAGCRNGTNLPYDVPRGNLEGYVYTETYNSSLAARRQMRVADRTTPTGYVAVSNALVELRDTSGNAVSDFNAYTTGSDGRFYFADVPSGAYTVYVTKSGMDPTSYNVTVYANTTTVANDQLGESAVSISPATSTVGTLTVSATADCIVQVPIEGTVFIKKQSDALFQPTPYSTPIAIINDISAGDYDVLVKASGYTDPASQPVSITATGQATLTFLLSPDGNAPPNASIQIPADGATFNQGTTITFTGAAADCEDGMLATGFKWTSDINGTIGTGATIRTSELSPGIHTITLTATDSGLLADTASIKITVAPNTSNNPPTATIVSPANGLEFSNGATINFLGAGTDPENGILTGASLVWYSDDVQIGTGTNFQLTTLAPGTHVIKLVATDNWGLTGTASVTVKVSTTAAQNNAPTVAIALPLNGGIYVQNVNINFVGAATDSEDGAITGNRLVWTISPGGFTTTGATFVKSDLAPNTYVVTLTATDSGGLSSSTSVSMTVSEPAE
ncbi:MAG TPA: PKD domain-containing protein [bacterium]|nr:PKD domain-containing protein [bacterium]